ncbi:transcription factor [Fusarium tjaetaba]|uniref:Transcription factor n=1 Tax=Fusarium tjaetaba TaxID=1567544 RepID=A0A8H5QIE3_9HYPO|nr:transcription factor [Fusarium tjaetaba]KAF5615082.1 transcription factor [Fusarium tjaetaba]
MSNNITHGPGSVSHKNPRVLACVLCQHRKIKCDRNTPCSNCIKANVTCTPSTPAPARKRRRPNQDLQERLARCEQLLKQYADGSVPSPSAVGHSPAANGTVDTYPATPTNVDGQSKWKPTGKMVKEEGGVRFMDSYLWANIHDELQAMREIVDTDDPEEASVMGSEDLSPDYNIDLLIPADTATRSCEELQPEPVHIFRLWQLFVDRVNPLTKIIHVPSVQPFALEMATDINKIPLNYQALLFAIFTMATVSLTETECLQMLGTSRDEALRRYTIGTKVALTKFNFLKNYDMVALQALLLYLLSLQNRYDRHAAWILSGMVVRIAQKMGYHRDGDYLGLNAFETEMRRRMWWQIILQDAKNALVSGLSHSLLPSSWDTKMPQNVNDADLFPGSIEPVLPREGPTEMAFCLIGYQIAKFLVNAESLHGTPGLEAAVMGHDFEGQDPAILPSIQQYRDLVDNLEQNLLEVEARYIDPTAGNVHIAALSIRPMICSKMREILVPMKEQPEWGTEILDKKDNLFKIVLMNNEHSTDAYGVMDQTGFLWFLKFHFQIDIFTVMTKQLCQRPTGSLADRAWNMVQKIYHYHTELLDISQKTYYIQAQTVLKAWKNREQAFRAAGQPLETPNFIYRLRDVVKSENRTSEPSPQQPVAHPPQNSQQMTDLDPFLGNYLDVSTLNWDLWGNMNQPPQQQQSQMPVSLFGNFPMGNMG